MSKHYYLAVTKQDRLVRVRRGGGGGRGETRDAPCISFAPVETAAGAAATIGLLRGPYGA